MRRVAVVTTSRADWGIYRPVLKRMRESPRLEALLLAGGTHLSPDHGLTVREIEGEGFEVAERIEMLLSSDSPEAVSKSVGLALLGYAQAFGRLAPDLLLLLGDRFEMHAAAVAAVPFRLPVAHIHGGEVTVGAFDDSLRHSLTKLSHLHFPSTEAYGRRIVQMGEEPWRVTVAGAPSLDNLAAVPRRSRREMEERLGVDLGAPFLLVTFHPATLDPGDPGVQAAQLLAALRESGLRAVVTMPNADPGGRAIREAVAAEARRGGTILAVENLGTEAYFSLMALASVMVGNSSSGLIEAASFGLPVVNVGERQRGRVRGPNVLDCPCEAAALASVLRRALDPAFRESLRGMANPYGDGRASERIVARLEEVELGPGLLVKRFADAPGGTP